MGQTSLVYKGIKMDSDEEVFVAMWLEELKNKRIIEDWIKVKDSWPLTEGLKVKYIEKKQLKTKIKEINKQKILLRPSEYTPDFKVIFNYQYENRFISSISTTEYRFNPNSVFFSTDTDFAYLEVKPGFDQNNMERSFKNNQKFIWDKFKIFVNLVEPISLFKSTFMPKEAAPYFKYKKAPTGKNKGVKKVGDWKMDWIPKTLNEYLCE